MFTNTKFIATALSITFLVACGGGGGGSSTANTSQNSQLNVKTFTNILVVDDPQNTSIPNQQNSLTISLSKINTTKNVFTNAITLYVIDNNLGSALLQGNCVGNICTHDPVKYFGFGYGFTLEISSGSNASLNSSGPTGENLINLDISKVKAGEEVKLALKISDVTIVKTINFVL